MMCKIETKYKWPEGYHSYADCQSPTGDLLLYEGRPISNLAKYEGIVRDI